MKRLFVIFGLCLSIFTSNADACSKRLCTVDSCCARVRLQQRLYWDSNCKLTYDAIPSGWENNTVIFSSCWNQPPEGCRPDKAWDLLGCGRWSVAPYGECFASTTDINNSMMSYTAYTQGGDWTLANTGVPEYWAGNVATQCNGGLNTELDAFLTKYDGASEMQYDTMRDASGNLMACVAMYKDSSGTWNANIGYNTTNVTQGGDCISMDLKNAINEAVGDSETGFAPLRSTGLYTSDSTLPTTGNGIPTSLENSAVGTGAGGQRSYIDSDNDGYDDISGEPMPSGSGVNRDGSTTQKVEVVGGSISGGSGSGPTAGEIGAAVGAEIDEAIGTSSVPSDPGFNEDVDTPEAYTFSEKVGGLLSNPFSDMMSGAGINVTGQDCVMDWGTFYGKAISINFCQYSEGLNAMGAIMLGLSYIISLIVIFR